MIPWLVISDPGHILHRVDQSTDLMTFWKTKARRSLFWARRSVECGAPALAPGATTTAFLEPGGSRAPVGDTNRCLSPLLTFCRRFLSGTMGQCVNENAGSRSRRKVHRPQRVGTEHRSEVVCAAPD